MEGEKSYDIEVAAPGLEKGDFNIDLTDGILTISSEKKDEKEDSSDKYIRKEFSFCSFSRSFTVPENVDQEGISASHKNGVLHIVLPKRDITIKDKSKKINIQ